MTVTLDQIYEQVLQLKTELENQLALRRISAEQVQVSEGLSDISERLGLIQAGEFRTGNSKVPGNGFSGVRIGYPPFSYDEKNWNLVGINNDKLQFGLNAEDGGAVAAGGLLKLNDGGMEVQSSGVAVRLTPAYSERPVEGWYLGGLNIGTSLRFGIHALGLQGGAAMIDDGFESGSLSGWTATGSPYISSSEKASGDYSAAITKNDYISKTFNTTADRFYLVYVKIKQTEDAIFELTGSNITSGYSPNPLTSFVTQNVWATHLYLLNSSSSTMTLNFKGWSSGSADPIYIDDIYVQEIYTYCYSGTLADGMGSYVLQSSGGIFLGTAYQGFTGQSIYMTGTGYGITINGGDVINLNGDVNMSTHLKLTEQSSTPGNPTSGTETKLYMKDDKLIIQFNDGGTVRYKYLDLTGTGVTWVHTTSAP